MNLHDYLAKANEVDVAQATGSSVHTVRKWRQGARTPSRKAAAALIEFSRGELSWGQIFGESPKQKAA